ncbi:hypothetical protein [Streptomyces microflavus]|uniref:hypothetical protein n=1 Tax=Streptomyces microflavus TaxID=1919 RepID=UPI000A6A6A84
MARTWPDSIAQQPVGQLPWGHIVLLMGKCPTRFDQLHCYVVLELKTRKTSPASRTTS